MAKRNLQIPKSIKSIITLLLALSIMVTSIQPLYATEPQKEIGIKQKVDVKSAMSEVIHTLRPFITESFENEMQLIKGEIIENGYDYFNTLESVTMVDNPIRRLNYASLMSAYMTVRTLDKNMLFCSLPIFTHTTEEATYTRMIPYKTNSYKKLKNGKYEKTGIKYIVEDCTIDTFEQLDNGYWKKTGTQDIKLDSEEVKYGIVTMDVLTGEELLAMYGVEVGSELYNEYLRRYQLIEACYSEAIQKQSAFVTVSRTDLIDSETQAHIDAILDEYKGTNQEVIVKTAVSLVGRVPYLWGGKPAMAGYDTSWFTYDPFTGQQKGLDCSGYVQWVFMTAGYPDYIYQNLLSTSSILATQEAISQSELQVGDFGLLNYGETINHVGIYLGDGYWIHCNGSADTVTIDKNTMFTIFRRCINISNEQLKNTIYIDSNTKKAYYTDIELQNLSKFVSALGKDSGLNTWVGLAEIVHNRVKSKEYPNTITEVLQDNTIYGLTLEEVEEEEPSEEIKQIVKDVLDENITLLPKEADSASLTPIQSEKMILIETIDDVYFYDLQW